MGLDLNYNSGQTPIDEDEKDGLLIPTITTREELDEFEMHNIESAIQWSLLKNFKQKEMFTEAFIRTLHKKMYGDVWGWAGEFRKTNKNLGVDKWEIGSELKKLLDDTVHWITNKIYSPDEAAIRFKHRIVSIHCFPNGNGRHSRLIADIIIEKIFKQPVFTWGAGYIPEYKNVRADYIRSLKAADLGDYSLLLNFARS